MASFNYIQICNSLFTGLPKRTKNVLVQRFGLQGQDAKTLEAIGQKYGITRERVRQIERDGLSKVQTAVKAATPKPFSYFISQLKSSNGLRKEEILLEAFGGKKFKNHVLFLLTMGEPFERLGEDKDLHAFWTVDKSAPVLARGAIESFIAKLEKINQPSALPKDLPFSYIEISKQILRTPDGLYGLRHWPETNPRTIKDKAYVVMKKQEKPMHFTDVAKYIGREALPQTVHNELIKDQRFVLVGRGLYALGEWGYAPGLVKDVIAKILKDRQKPVPRAELVSEVLKQRLVKESTILLNLQNKKYFAKDQEGKYTIREA